MPTGKNFQKLHMPYFVTLGEQKALKFEVLLICLLFIALSTMELETDWPARSQDNGLGWDITVYPWLGVSVG